MELYIDSADVKEIERLVAFYPVDGVTTNPSIVAKAKNGDFSGLLKKIRSIIGEDRTLFVQVIGKTAEEMLDEAREVKKTIGGKISIKVPVSEEGLKAIRLLKDEGFTVTATAIFTPLQALLSAKSGADYVAPYINRLDNNGGSGVQVVSEIAEIFSLNSIKTKILAASFRNTDQIKNVILAGAETVTASPDLFEPMVSNLLSVNAVEKFDKDWAGIYGDKSFIEALK